MQTQSVGQIEQCPYRRPVENSGDSGKALCGLLTEISGVHSTKHCQVTRAACEACCQSFRPSPRDLNPIVAGLLYNLTDEITSQGGVPGCDAVRVAELNQFAEHSIPAVAPDEDDGSVVKTASISPGPLPDLKEILPPPAQRCDPAVRKWSVGVTTAPRRLSTLSACLDSLINAGWDAPRLFIDSPVEIEPRFSALAKTLRETKVGAWPNFYLALTEMVMRDLDADAFMMVQDDVVFYEHPDLRNYLEQILWPGSVPGLVSLFCPRDYTQPQPGWHVFDGEWFWGAQAFVFSKEAAQLFLSDWRVLMHRWNPQHNGIAQIDVLTGKWAYRSDVTVYYPTPSLVQHIGHISALWTENHRAVGPRHADQFAGDFEAEQE